MVCTIQIMIMMIFLNSNKNIMNMHISLCSLFHTWNNLIEYHQNLHQKSVKQHISTPVYPNMKSSIMKHVCITKYKKCTQSLWNTDVAFESKKQTKYIHQLAQCIPAYFITVYVWIMNQHIQHGNKVADPLCFVGAHTAHTHCMSLWTHWVS